MDFDDELMLTLAERNLHPPTDAVQASAKDMLVLPELTPTETEAFCAIDSLTPVHQKPLLRLVRPGEGPGKKRTSKAFGERELAHVLARIAALSKVPESDTVKVLLTYRAGLRPSEVAWMTKRTLLDADGMVKETLVVHGATSKWCKHREIPMHPQLKAAIEDLFAAYPDAERVAFSGRSDGGYRYQTAGALFLWFAALYLGAGLHSCTGMSGRRSFATALAQYAPLPMVQKVLGHVNLATTSIYVNEAKGDAAPAIRKLGSN